MMNIRTHNPDIHNSILDVHKFQSMEMHNLIYG